MHSPAALTSFRRVLTADLSDVSSNDDAKPGSAGSSPSVQREDSALASRPHPLPDPLARCLGRAPLLAPTGEIGGACSPRPIVRRRGACRGVERRGRRSLLLAPGHGHRPHRPPHRGMARETEIGQVARALGTSARTLQRRLSSAGSLTKKLLDTLRRDTAERSIAESSLSIGEIAYLVGYSEPAPFHRAFKRWTGLTPLAYRERVRERRCKFASP